MMNQLDSTDFGTAEDPALVMMMTLDLNAPPPAAPTSAAAEAGEAQRLRLQYGSCARILAAQARLLGRLREVLTEREETHAAAQVSGLLFLRGR